MKKYNPQEIMPDENTEILGYFGDHYKYVVAKYIDGAWYEAWGDIVMYSCPEYWIDLDDIGDSLK